MSAAASRRVWNVNESNIRKLWEIIIVCCWLTIDQTGHFTLQVGGESAGRPRRSFLLCRRGRRFVRGLVIAIRKDK